jgi:AcrR family transcriptional regulator
MPRNLSPSDVANFRDRLCDVATQLLAELGQEGFNMRELAARMGVSAMTTYRYFKDKNEILLAVRERAFARFADRLEAVTSCGADREERLAALSLVYAAFARDERVHYALMFDLSSPQPSASARTEEQRARSAMYACLCEQDGGDGELAASILWSALHGIVALHSTGKLGEIEFERALAEIVHAAATTPRGVSPFPKRFLPANDSAPARASTAPEPAYNHVHSVALSPAE